MDVYIGQVLDTCEINGERRFTKEAKDILQLDHTGKICNPNILLVRIGRIGFTIQTGTHEKVTMVIFIPYYTID